MVELPKSTVVWEVTWGVQRLGVGRSCEVSVLIFVSLFGESPMKTSILLPSTVEMRPSKCRFRAAAKPSLLSSR